MNAVVEDVAEYYPADSADLPPLQPSVIARPKPRLQAVNGTQKRKINRIVGRAVAIEMLAAGAGEQLDYGLMSIDRIEQRWAVSIGAGLPSDAYDDSPSARPSPLDDVTAIIVDQINLKAPAEYAFLLRAWYKSPMPATAIGENLGLNRNDTYRAWKAALSYLRYRFLATNHKDLINLVNLR